MATGTSWDCFSCPDEKYPSGMDDPTAHYFSTAPVRPARLLPFLLPKLLRSSFVVSLGTKLLASCKGSMFAVLNANSSPLSSLTIQRPVSFWNSLHSPSFPFKAGLACKSRNRTRALTQIINFENYLCFHRLGPI